MPHDCKQYDFSSGTLESLGIWNIPVLWPSTNLEMTHIFLIILYTFFSVYSASSVRDHKKTPTFLEESWGLILQ